MGDKYNVMHVVFSLECGGLEKVAIDLAAFQNRDGRFAASICCLDQRGEMAAQAERQGIKIFCLDRKPGVSFTVPFKMARLLRQENIHLIHAHNLGAMVYGGIGAKLAGTPAVITTRHGREKKVMNRLVWSLNDRIVAISNDAKEEMLSHNHIDPKKAEVIYNGIDTARFPLLSNERDSSKEEAIIGTVGRLSPEKGHNTLIDAFAGILKKGKKAKLVIAGDGILRNELEQQCMALGIKDKVQFLGFMEDIGKVLKSFDIFALPSMTEGISLGLLEAMASGKPVIATNVGGNPEVVLDGVTGYLVSPQNGEELCRRALQLMEDRELSRKMGEAGRKRVEDSFNLRKMSDKYEELYYSLLRDKKTA